MSDTVLRKSEFRDPIHGFIYVYPHEKEIIDTCEFQRLRRIHQLGLSSYVYHGAEHSRLGHSLGVMHLAGEAVNRIFEKNRVELTKSAGIGDTDALSLNRRLYYGARLAGLLHDIGHAPFSHPGEVKLFLQEPKKLGHEDYTIAAILKSKIGSIIDKHKNETKVSAEDVVNIIDNDGIYQFPFVKSLISSPWDVDKMDYLLRDSRFCGVEYGIYDLKRLLDTLTLDNGYQTGGLQLAIQAGGVHTVEALILARYFMFTQVYFHDVRRAFDIILTEFIGDCLADRFGKRTYPPPELIDDYLKLDDSFILAKAVEEADEGKRNLAWRIVARRHYKLVCETMPHPTPLIQKRIEALKETCKKEFQGIKFWLDRAVDHPEKFRKEDLPIMMEGNATPKSLSQESAVLKGLQEIGQCRIYTDADDTLIGKITSFCNDFMN